MMPKDPTEFVCSVSNYLRFYKSILQQYLYTTALLVISSD